MLHTLSVAFAIAAQASQSLPIDSSWALSGAGTRIEEFRGTKAIRIRTGRAIRRDISFQNGTIDLDVALTPHRSFVYVQFRMQDDANYEEFYLRPHKSALPDAIQYAPVWNGESNWQLFHAREGTAAVPFERDVWTHVRIVMRDAHAAIFVDDTLVPDLVVRLARPTAPGYLAVRAFVPAGGAPDGVMAASFANIVVRPDKAPSFSLPAADSVPTGMITRWQLSPAFRVEPGVVTSLPESLLATRARWPTIAAEPNGVTIIGRHVARPAPQSATIARLVLRAPSPTVQRLDLGFSDYVTVFVNGRPHFAADAHYSFDAPRQEGVIGLHQSTVWLPLIRGDNEILLAVADGFGGWGLMGRLHPVTGVTIVPPPR
jgi:hypothetical protein